MCCSLTLYKAQLYYQTLGSLLLQSHLLSATLSCQMWSPAQNKSLFMFWFQVPDQCDFQFSSVLAKSQVHQPYYKLLKIGVCNGSADTGLNIGMSNIIIMMQGEMSKKDMIVEHSKRASLINHLIHLRK